MNNKIIAIPSEHGMRFFLYNENKISWGSTGFIIPFLRKSNLSALLPTSSSKLHGSKFSTGAAFRGVPLSPPAKTGLVASTSRRRLIELAGLERLLAVQIVDLALVSVAEHVIGLGYLLELGLRLLLVLPVLIRMPLHRQTLVRSLQVFIGRVLRDFQYVIDPPNNNNNKDASIDEVDQRSSSISSSSEYITLVDENKRLKEENNVLSSELSTMKTKINFGVSEGQYGDWVTDTKRYRSATQHIVHAKSPLGTFVESSVFQRDL
nr:heat stress transcription factor B-3 [Ipomoea batatas]